MKKIILSAAIISLLVGHSAFAISVSRGGSFSRGSSFSRSSSYSSSKSSFTSSGSYKSSTPASKGSSYSSSETTYIKYAAPAAGSTQSSFFTPTNAMLMYMLYQNHSTQNEIEEVKKAVANNGFSQPGVWYYNANGCDINGFKADGAWCYDKDGYDINGYNAAGVARNKTK